MPKLPPRARWELIQGVLAALDSDVRQLILAHLFEAGEEGLRSSELARKLDRSPDLLRKHLMILEQALLVLNEVGRDEGGVYSRYRITEFGEDWLERVQLKENGRALPLLA